MHSQGMTHDVNYREHLTRLSTALAITEAAYVEAKRSRELQGAMQRSYIWETQGLIRCYGKEVGEGRLGGG